MVHISRYITSHYSDSIKIIDSTAETLVFWYVLIYFSVELKNSIK